MQEGAEGRVVYVGVKREGLFRLATPCHPTCCRILFSFAELLRLPFTSLYPVSSLNFCQFDAGRYKKTDKCSFQQFLANFMIKNNLLTLGFWNFFSVYNVFECTNSNISRWSWVYCSTEYLGVCIQWLQCYLQFMYRRARWLTRVLDPCKSPGWSSAANDQLSSHHITADLITSSLLQDIVSVSSPTCDEPHRSCHTSPRSSPLHFLWRVMSDDPLPPPRYTIYTVRLQFLWKSLEF